MASSEEKYEFEVEEENLQLVKTEIKSEGNTEVIDDRALQDATTPLPKYIFQIKGMGSLSPPPCEVKSEEGSVISDAFSSPGHKTVVGKVVNFSKLRGKCPGCRRPFDFDRYGFDDVARHIFFVHKKNHRRYLFALRMLYGSPYSFAADQRRGKGSNSRTLALRRKVMQESGRVLRSNKSKLNNTSENLKNESMSL